MKRKDISIPFDQLVFGNPHWDAPQAIDEIMVYSDLIAHLDRQRESLNTRHENEEVTLINVQSVLMAYALEIAMKSLWAMDNPVDCMCHTHDLLYFYKGLQSDTVTSLQDLGLTEDRLKGYPSPFVTNRYSMEYEVPEQYEKRKVIVKGILLKTTWELATRNAEEKKGRPLVPHSLRMIQDTSASFVTGPRKNRITK